MTLTRGTCYNETAFAECLPARFYNQLDCFSTFRVYIFSFLVFFFSFLFSSRASFVLGKWIEAIAARRRKGGKIYGMPITFDYCTNTYFGFALEILIASANPCLLI